MSILGRLNGSRNLLLVFALLLFSLAQRPFFADPAAAQEASSVDDLWIDLRMGPPLIPLYNEVARDDDIARVDDPGQIGQLRATTRGRRMVVFKSIPEAQQALPGIASEIDIIGYNFESGSTTPSGELADPVESVMAMRALADAYGLQLAFGPDHELALSHGVEVAPFVDIFVLQIQRQQTNPRVVQEFVRPVIPALRAANPDLEVSVQVRTEGDTGQLIDLLDALKADLDGVSILTSPETVETAEELVRGLRAGESLLVTTGRQFSNILYVILGVLLGVAGSFLYRRSRQET
jgi:LPXTG-motif cell wall-anchored protein